MSEYFIKANSFAAPFFSDTDTKFVDAGSPEAALEQFAASYKHPAGLFSAAVWRDANAEAKGERPLARWISNHAAAKDEICSALGGYRYCGHGPGYFEVDGKKWSVTEPYEGAVYPVVQR